MGKSTLLLRYVEGEYNPQKPTIGIDYRFKKVEHEGESYNLELWDSAGQERYRTIVYNYFKLSKAACVVFDITNEESLKDAKNWMEQLILHCGKDIPKVLIANKCDLYDPEKLQSELERIKPTIEKLKEEYGCEFFAVSAYTGENVDKAFAYLIKELVEKYATNTSPKKKSNTFKLTS